MDGLSGAASVVAIIQLLESIHKLVEFGKSVQKVPANVKALVNDLELLSAVISRTEKVSSRIKVDDVANSVIKDCCERISDLDNKIGPTISHLNSDSFRRRTWSSFKFALKSNEIALLRQSITDAKVTLNIVLQNSILDLSISILDNQQHAFVQFQQFQQLSQSVNIFHTSNITKSTTMQLPAIEFQKYTNTKDTLRHGVSAPSALDVPAGENNPTLLKDPSVFNVPAGENNPALRKDQNEPQTDLSPRPFRNARTPLASWERTISTPFIHVATRSTTWKVIEADSAEPKKAEKAETELRSILYPSRGGRLLGISHGLLVTARSTVGWRYTIEPFRAVPENALIFDLCRLGNVDGVKLLLQRGEASPLDRDPMGRTPLWVAAKSLKLDVAELLLREGADPHAQDWKGDSEPIATIAQSEGMLIQPKLKMINILQERRREDYEDMTLLFMLGIFFRKYRPQTSFDLSWNKRRSDILEVVQTVLHTIPSGKEGDSNRAKLLVACIRFYFEGDVLRYILSGIEGKIDEKEKPSSLGDSILHESIQRRLLERDPQSMSVIMQKTENFHLKCANEYSGFPPHTPTMLAMSDPNLFIAWRAALLNLNIDVHAFVHAELEQGALRTAGWNQLSLTYIFEADLTPALYDGPRTFGFPLCERCGHKGTGIGSHLKVDLGWRRYLKSIRKRYSIPTVIAEKPSVPESFKIVLALGSNNISSNNQRSNIIEDRSENTLKDLPYRIVCSTACGDGLCVAWIYENESTLEPNLPLYPQEIKVQNDEDLIRCVNEQGGNDNSLCMKIPGAFVD